MKDFAKGIAVSLMVICALMLAGLLVAYLEEHAIKRDCDRLSIVYLYGERYFCTKANE